jgi:hypothetical protein
MEAGHDCIPMSRWGSGITHDGSDPVGIRVIHDLADVRRASRIHRFEVGKIGEETGLERVIDAGIAVGARDWIKHDPDFKSLRNHRRFQAIVKRISAA